MMTKFAKIKYKKQKILARLANIHALVFWQKPIFQNYWGYFGEKNSKTSAKNQYKKRFLAGNIGGEFWRANIINAKNNIRNGLINKDGGRAYSF